MLKIKYALQCKNMHIRWKNIVEMLFHSCTYVAIYTYCKYRTSFAHKYRKIYMFKFLFSLSESLPHQKMQNMIHRESHFITT